jgi:hypothetical protein
METVLESDHATLFKAGSEVKPILCELVAGSGTIDKDFYLSNYPELESHAALIPQMYYFLGSSSERMDLIALMKNDPIRHNTADSWVQVRKKIRWRIANAVNQTNIAESGLTGRISRTTNIYDPKHVNRLFLTYCLLFLPPIIDGFKLAVRWRRVGLMWHALLTYYVVFSTAMQYLSKFTRGKNQLRRYGQ